MLGDFYAHLQNANTCNYQDIMHYKLLVFCTLPITQQQTLGNSSAAHKSIGQAFQRMQSITPSTVNHHQSPMCISYLVLSPPQPLQIPGFTVPVDKLVSEFVDAAISGERLNCARRSLPIVSIFHWRPSPCNIHR